MSTLSEDPVLSVMDTPDLLEIIFTYLHPADVKHARLVSRLWSSVIEKPKYLRWARISLASRGLASMTWPARAWPAGAWPAGAWQGPCWPGQGWPGKCLPCKPLQKVALTK